MKPWRIAIVTFVILALLLPVLYSTPEPVEAALIEPTVYTMNVYLHDTTQQLVYAEIWGSPGTYFFPWGYAEIYAQFKEPGGEWQDSSKTRLTSIGTSEETFLYFASGRDMTIEVRGALDYYGNLGIAVGTIYGTTWEVYIPPVETDPYVNTGYLTRLSSTSIRGRAWGDPAGQGTGRIYLEYRKVGGGAWTPTAKTAISGFDYDDWDITGLDAGDPYEVRAAMDYPSPGYGTSIYGEIVQIWDVPTGLECETQPSGAGTVGDPYVITDICELQWMRNSLAAYYELGNDIDASETQHWNWSESGQRYEGFLPVGTSGAPFTGRFDGKGFAIYGLHINRPATSNVGLFGYANTLDRYLRNVSFRDAYIVGYQYVGTLLGRAAVGKSTTTYLDISQCRADNVYVSAVYNSYPSPAGGLVGYATYSARLSYCHVSNAEVASLGWYAAGVVGGISSETSLSYAARLYRCSATNVDVQADIHAGGLANTISYVYVDECFSTGTVAAIGTGGRAGGLTSLSSGNVRISNSYSRCAVNGGPGTGAGTYTGGLDGRLGYTTTDPVDKCYSTGTVVGGAVSLRGGLIGSDGNPVQTTNSFWDTQTSGMATSAGGTGKTTAQMKTTTTFTDAGWDFTTIWGRSADINDGYPYLQALEYELEVITHQPSYIDATSMVAEGEITAADPNAYTRGFVYMEGTTGDPTLSDLWVTESADFGVGTFSLDISNLSSGTYYRLRAFAVSDHVFAYGNTITVQTTVGPTVVTQPAEQMPWHSWRERRLHGYLESDGGSDCSVRFQYGLDPGDLDQATSWRDTVPGVCPPRGYQSGEGFHTDIVLLSAVLGQTWYFRAQAENDEGLSSGEILMFTLGDEGEEDEGLVVVTYAATDRTGTSFIARGALTVANPEAFRRGFVYIEGGYGVPDLTDDYVEEGGSFGVGSFGLSISGLTIGEECRVRAFAENINGVVYGNTMTVAAVGAPVVSTYAPTDIGETTFRARGEVTETGATITRRGFVYIEGITGTPTLTDSVVDEYGSWGAAPYNLAVTGLTGGTYYRVRAFATNDIGTSYGSTVTVRTYGTPDVTTNAATHIGLTTARLHGVITDDGGDTCEWRLQWGEATGVYDYDSSWTGSLTSGQSFYVDISGLSPDTTYYFRAQGRNAVGLASGSELSFTTSDGLGDPSDLLATPISGTEIALTWVKGGGTDNTIIQMQQSAYPSSVLHGTTVYSGIESATTVTALTPGTTYYFRAWGEGAGNYSAGYTEDMATTLAGSPVVDPPDDEEPDGWFQDPDHSGLENMPFYQQINNLFDSYGLPYTTGWALCALLLAAILGVLTLVLTNGNIWLAMTAGGSVLVGTMWIGLIPFWILLIYLVSVGGYAFIRSRV